MIDAPTLGEFLRTEFPMACHFLVGATLGRFNQNRIVGPHDRLLQLGATHRRPDPRTEQPRRGGGPRHLRAADQGVAGLRNKLALLADGSMSRHSMQALVDIQQRGARCVDGGARR